jgi:hypothetical protein
LSRTEKSFRCPACGVTCEDRDDAVVLLCEGCGESVQRTSLVAGRDGIWGVRPDPPSDGWDGRFEAVFPDGGREELDLKGRVLRPGDSLPGTDFVLEEWEVTDEPVQEGLFGIVGVLGRR